LRCDVFAAVLREREEAWRRSIHSYEAGALEPAAFGTMTFTGPMVGSRPALICESLTKLTGAGSH
jgi:hypothetical protein